MPVFNGRRFIAEAVTSVLASTFRSFELLVLDDGSSDDSAAEAMRAAAGDPRLRVIPLPHGGVAAARNAGLREARGEFIANLDADDAMFPERLARQVDYLDHHAECVAIGSRCVAVNADGTPIRILGRFLTHEAIDQALLGGNGGGLGNPGAMFRRAAARSVGGYEGSLHSTGEDHDLWLRLAEIGKLACLPEVLTVYRVHAGNVSVGEGTLERRLPVTLETLRRAFARRGITGREPAKLPNPPVPAGERWGNRALLRYYAGRRAGAMGAGLIALMLSPTDVAVRSAWRTIFSGSPPAWKGR